MKMLQWIAVWASQAQTSGKKNPKQCKMQSVWPPVQFARWDSCVRGGKNETMQTALH